MMCGPLGRCLALSAGLQDELQCDINGEQTERILPSTNLPDGRSEPRPPLSGGVRHGWAETRSDLGQDSIPARVRWLVSGLVPHPVQSVRTATALTGDAVVQQVTERARSDAIEQHVLDIDERVVGRLV